MEKTKINLVPDTKNPSPDYYCTWQTQLYATSDGKPKAQRAIIGEKSLFEDKKPFGWAYFYEKAREDLFLVMDDSWDVPLSGDPSFYGSLLLSKEKFPEDFLEADGNVQAMKHLVSRIREIGWKGLGGWIHAGASQTFQKNLSEEEYWKTRLREADESGLSYWKVDWGPRAGNALFRKMLTLLGKELAPTLTIEHAVTKEAIAFSDVYRTYDVPALMSIPITMEKLASFSDIPRENFHALLNCEDEVYMAAAGGFVMGVMRHPYAGGFMDGKADPSFPSVHRNLKTKMFEVVRAVKWHRIAPAFCGDVEVSKNFLEDSWHFLHPHEEMEAWWFDMPMIKDHMQNGVLTKSAPSAIARNCDLPYVFADEKGMVPYVVVAKNPNGVFSVATLGRTRERSYQIPHCDISIYIGNAETVGVFGEYRTLVLQTDRERCPRVLMQDLASDYAYDVTARVSFAHGFLTVSGDLISQIGKSAQPASDTSEPGVVIVLH